MLGLIKKDFLLIKSNLKSIVIILVIYLALAFQGSFDITYIFPLIGLMLFISTFSYDDFNNWNAYAITLPNGRKNVVRAKYLSSILLALILVIVSLIMSIVINYVKNIPINLEETISLLAGIVLSNVIVISLLYPIFFKFGSTNGRLILFVVIFGITVILAVIAKFVDFSFLKDFIDALDRYLFIEIPIISVILLIISYFVSNKIYKNKEF